MYFKATGVGPCNLHCVFVLLLDRRVSWDMMLKVPITLSQLIHMLISADQL